MPNTTSHSTTCKANGCPLPYDVVTNRWPSENKKQKGLPRWGVCRFHHEADGRNWGAVTARIKKNISIFQLFARINAISNDDYKPTPCETMQHWQDRVNAELTKEILNRQKDGDYMQYIKELNQTLQAQA